MTPGGTLPGPGDGCKRCGSFTCPAGTTFSGNSTKMISTLTSFRTLAMSLQPYLSVRSRASAKTSPLGWIRNKSESLFTHSFVIRSG